MLYKNRYFTNLFLWFNFRKFLALLFFIYFSISKEKSTDIIYFFSFIILDAEEHEKKGRRVRGSP
ncbi:unnamed protein product [Brassica oleracea]